MSNRTQMRTQLRVELGDSTTPYVWSDGLLDDLLVQAAGWYSRLFPLQAVAYRDVAESQRTFDAPPGVFGIAQVECPPGVVLPLDPPGASAQSPRAGLRQSWSVWGGTVALGNPASGPEVGVGNLVMRVLLPWDRPDPTENWNGPENDERLLVLWSAVEAYAWLAGQDQKRGRISKSQDMASRYAAQLESEVAARARAARSRRLTG